MVTYYGKTLRHYFTRAFGVMGTSNLARKCIKNTKESAISDHCCNVTFPINFDDADILASNSNKFKLLIKESLLIKRDNSVLNRVSFVIFARSFRPGINVYFL